MLSALRAVERVELGVQRGDPAVDGVEPLAELDRLERLRPLRGIVEPLGRADEQPSGDRRQLGGGRGGLLAGDGRAARRRVALVADDGHSRFPKKTRVGGRNVASANAAPSAVGVGSAGGRSGSRAAAPRARASGRSPADGGTPKPKNTRSGVSVPLNVG